ncbi:hypothetical protein ACIRF8_10510 [Streptomyces sp. NPDC102406]|uniref:hypothetical protein n=1 Tax=Streptomyces sp. NPDC102406 TaxID=3366171 RepID=UPI00382595C1
MRRRLVHTAVVLALSTTAAALATASAAADDRLDVLSATAENDHVEVAVRYRCESLMGTDTLDVALADTAKGGIYSASITPVCDNALHKAVVETARNAGPVAAAHRDVVITASLGAGPTPQLFPTATKQVTMALKSRS